LEHSFVAPEYEETFRGDAKIAVVISSDKSVESKEIFAKLRAVEKYFDAVSYDRARVRFEEASCACPTGETRTLDKPDAPVTERKAFLKQLLSGLDKISLVRYEYVLLALDSSVWPFTIPYPLSELPELRGAAVISLNNEWSTIAHEVGHLFGLPDLYDHRLADQGLEAAIQFGPWCLMSRSNARPGLSAWSKLYLGWLIDAEVARVKRNETRIIQLDALEARGSNFLAIEVKLASNRYYLVEARTKMGWDACLPQEGIIITLVDFFAEHYSDRIRVVDARPQTKTLNDAPFDAESECNEFNDALNEIQIVVLSRRGNTYSVYVRNGVS
jgi:hypothetical protein